MNNFWTRTITGAVFVAVMIGCIWWNYWSLAGLFFLIIFLGLWEFYSLAEVKNIHPPKILGILLGISVMLFFVSLGKLRDEYISWSSIAALGIFFLLFAVELFRQSENPFANISFAVCGIFYIVLPFGLLILISSSGGIFSSWEFKPHPVLGYFFLLWANDTFAYLVGRAIGKRKLFERISPKKTWEGTIGGILCTQGIAYLLSTWFTEFYLMD